MPIYEFHCAGCGENFEELVFSQSSTITCPNARAVKSKSSCQRLHSNPEVILSAAPPAAVAAPAPVIAAAPADHHNQDQLAVSGHQLTAAANTDFAPFQPACRG